jgi:hypothetical protein
MTTVEFSEDDLILVHHALNAFLSDFGHDEKDVRRRLVGLLERFPSPVAAA